eukprot:TRINITY_DN77465_c0_g1_i1.p1 TRINITY_DN77465_c0_g1~~TRINITY_DN77465_c0_g1_i1.p1  ORF type:complete len:419 (-),score=83.26 TRINITY_DN77465_c0_g1_i1:80-1336(-)
MERTNGGLAADGNQEVAPWFVEIPESKLKYVVGPENIILKRLGEALRCPLEADKPRKKRQREVKFQGQTQFVDEGDSEQMVKIFMKGGAKRRLMAIDVIRGVADGEDPEDHAARAEGALVLPHDIRDPDRQAWIRWRLVLSAHAVNARAHFGLRTMRLHPRVGSQFAADVESRVEAIAEAVVAEGTKLTEIIVEAKDELEPEDAPSDLAVIPLVDQYGVIVRVSDQDDNAVQEFMKIRVIGPLDPAQDAVTLLRAKFVDGKSTGSLLQAKGQVQAMTATMANDFRVDLKTLEEACKVKVHLGQTMFGIIGDTSESVSSAKGMLREMLQFYFSDACSFHEGLKPPLVERLFQDMDLGVLMAKPTCSIQIDEQEGTVWVCGDACADVNRRIDEIAQLPAETDTGTKKRRTSALSFHSETF